MARRALQTELVERLGERRRDAPSVDNVPRAPGGGLKGPAEVARPLETGREHRMAHLVPRRVLRGHGSAVGPICPGQPSPFLLNFPTHFAIAVAKGRLQVLAPGFRLLVGPSRAGISGHGAS